jgi:hypothetical protein
MYFIKLAALKHWTVSFLKSLKQSSIGYCYWLHTISNKALDTYGITFSFANGL